MRINGRIIIELSDTEVWRLTSECHTSSELVVPFCNLPLYPEGTSLYVTAEEGEFYLEDLEILSYTGHNDRGTDVECSHSCLVSMLQKAIQFCDFEDHQGKSATWTYRGVIDFSQC